MKFDKIKNSSFGTYVYYSNITKKLDELDCLAYNLTCVSQNENSYCLDPMKSISA